MIIILETKSKKGCFTTDFTRKGLQVFNVFDNIQDFLAQKKLIKSVKFGLNVLNAIRRLEKYAKKEEISYKNVVEFSKTGIVYTNNHIFYKADIPLELPGEMDKIYIHLDMLAHLKTASMVYLYKSNTTNETYAVFDNLNGERILMQLATKDEVGMPDYQEITNLLLTGEKDEIGFGTSARTLIESNKNHPDLRITVIAENNLVLHTPSYYNKTTSIQHTIKSNIFAPFDTTQIATVISQNSRFYIDKSTGSLIAENLEGFRERTLLTRTQYINCDSEIFEGYKIKNYEEYQKKVKEMLQIYLERDENISIAA